jgi:RimJ/RimL family protein N-acetyltransferase
VSTLAIDTPRLRLILESTEEILARIEALNAEDRAQVSAAWLDQLRAARESSPWTHGFVAVDRVSGAKIGGCGFKGPPGEARCVEIAYGVNAEYRGRGYAKEMAAALTAFALDEGRAHTVCAHTLPENGASARVLAACGFTWMGEVVDPEDGLVWRWERLPEEATRIP